MTRRMHVPRSLRCLHGLETLTATYALIPAGAVVAYTSASLYMDGNASFVNNTAGGSGGMNLVGMHRLNDGFNTAWQTTHVWFVSVASRVGSELGLGLR